MKYSQVCIEAVAAEIPKNIVSSQSIEDSLQPLYQTLNIPLGSLEKWTGIRERRFWDNGTTPSQGSIWAAEKALHQAKLNPKEIGCLFHCAVSRDCLEPATSTFVHHRLTLPEKCMVFDISNASLGFMNGVLTAANMIELGQAKAALVVSSEYSRELVEEGLERLLENPNLQEFHHAFPTLTRGDGAVAMVLTHKSISQTGHQLLGGALRCGGLSLAKEHPWNDSENSENTQNTRFLKRQMLLVREVWQHFMGIANWTPEIVQKTFYHFVDPKGHWMHSLNLKKSQVFSVMEYFGNLVSIGVPMALVNGLEKKLLSQGDCFTLVGSGADLNCLMLGAIWNTPSGSPVS